MKKIAALIFAVFISTAFALDNEARQTMVQKAKDFTGSISDPIYVTEEGVVGFEGNVSNLDVLFDTQTLEIIGYRNYDLIGDGIERYSQSQAQQKAESIFPILPDYKSEYTYYTFQKTYPFDYVFTWKRYVNGTMIYDDDIFARVDYTNLNLIEWYIHYTKELPPESESVTDGNSTVTEEEAREIASSQGSVQGSQIGIINQKPEWIIDVKTENGTIERFEVDGSGNLVDLQEKKREPAQANIIPSLPGTNNWLFIPIGILIFIGIVLLFLKKSYNNMINNKDKLRKAKFEAKRQIAREKRR